MVAKCLGLVKISDFIHFFFLLYGCRGSKIWKQHYRNIFTLPSTHYDRFIQGTCDKHVSVKVSRDYYTKCFPATMLLISVTCVKWAVRFKDLSLNSNFGSFNTFIERHPKSSSNIFHSAVCKGFL